MKIYIDLDGVITNFNKLYCTYSPYELNSKDYVDTFWNYWNSFVSDKGFEKLELLPDAKYLMTELDKLGLPIEILSSSGGGSTNDIVMEQKLNWLKSNGITYPPNIVPGGSKKAAYAKPDTILIDDTLKVISKFISAGGIGILHKQTESTLRTLNSILSNTKS